MNPKKFFGELQRRNVYKVAAAYAVVSWLLIQIATQTFPVFDIPSWASRFVILVLLLGFPVALVLAWAYELTPEGIKRTEEVAPSESIARSTGRKIEFVIIGVLLVVIAFLLLRHYGPIPARAVEGVPEKSIAVLPFADLSASGDQEYFSDGITEQIINSLAKIRGLFVVARTSALVFKHKREDIRQVGRTLGVSHVLEGSVRRGTGKVRIDARLIDVKNGYQLWSEAYDSAEQDFLSLQSDVAQKVASALQIELELADAAQLTRPPTQNAEAYDLYLRGRHLLNKRTIDSIQKASELFKQAVAKDSRFALGHVGMADAYILLGEYGAMPTELAAKAAWPRVDAALQIDDKLAEAHVSRAMLLAHFEWDWPAAEASYRKALELSPNSARARHWYALHLGELARYDEALAQIEIAKQHDPLAPIIRAAKGKLLFVARRYDEAIAVCREALDLEPNFAPAWSVMGQVYASQQKFPEAIEAAAKYVELAGGGESFLELAYVYAAAGRQAETDATMREVSAAGPYDRATISAAARDEAGALHWLSEAVKDNSIAVVWARVDPRLDNVRAHPEFQKLVSKLARKPQRTS